MELSKEYAMWKIIGYDNDGCQSVKILCYNKEEAYKTFYRIVSLSYLKRVTIEKLLKDGNTKVLLSQDWDDELVK